MDFISAREDAEKWGLKPRAVQTLCCAGRIAGAKKFERSWMIPAGAEHPTDLRRKEGAEEAACPGFCLDTVTVYRPFPEGFGLASAPLAGLPQGSAAARLFDAQLLYLRGHISKAASLANAILRGLCGGETAMDSQVILAIDSLYSGSLDRWNRAIGKIACSEVSPRLRELTLGLMGVSVYDLSLIPDWLPLGDFSGFAGDRLPLAWYVYVKWLYVRKKYEAAFCAALPLIAQCRAKGVVVAELQLSSLAAAALHVLNDDQAALRHLNRALDLAMPRGFIFFFVECKRELDTLLEEAMRRRASRSTWLAIRRQNDRLFAGWARLYNSLTGNNISPELTPREQEALKYAAMKLSTAEIARRMGVAASSVKSYLNEGYAKMGVSRKAELQGKS